MGFAIDDVPTADLMELAAKLLELDAATIARVQEIVKVLRPDYQPTDAAGESNLNLAAAIRERARRVRELETQ
jgi:hypothetical protein